MFKLVALFAIFAIVSARPGYLGSSALTYVASPVIHQEYVKVHEPVVANVGTIIESVPSAVSHQSSTVVHGHSHITTPILTPAIKTYHTPILRTYASAPIAYNLWNSHNYAHSW